MALVEFHMLDGQIDKIKEMHYEIDGVEMKETHWEDEYGNRSVIITKEKSSRKIIRNTPIIDGVRERKDIARKRLLDKFTKRRMDEPEENKVATIILSQLGGGKFIMMTGAKDLVDGGNYLMFTLRRGTAKDGINKVRITLEPSDTYKVEFMKINYKTLDVKTVKEYDDIYADQLVEIFESTTGLYTHL